MTLPVGSTTFGLRRNVVANLDASGNGESRIENLNAGVLWIVRQISVICRPTASGTTCTVTPPTGIIDTSYFAGTGDVAAGDPPIYLYSGDFILLTWADGPASGQGVCTYYYDEVVQ